MANVTKDLGPVSAYAVAVAHGYQGTEEEWAKLQMQAGTNAQRAVNAAAGSEASAQEAGRQAENAANSAAAAKASADLAAQTEAEAKKTLESIPADYTELKQEVGGLSKEIVESDIPKIYFTGTTPTSKDEGDLRLFMRYISKTARIEKHVTLKVQGSSSVNYPKKNFTMKVYADGTYDKKEKLQFRAWPAMNKFVLKAHWMDHSHVRNVGTAKIWGKIVASRSDYASLPEELRTAANNGATDGFTCKVFVNGVYQGLYELIVPKDALFGQDKDIATHSIMCSELNNQPTCAFATTTPTISGNWSEELQDSMSPEIATSFADFIKFVAGSTDEEFVANAETYFDVQSVIDFNILARVFCIVDNLCRNQIFFSYDGKKWYEGAWDFDAVLGNPPTARGFYAWDTAFQSGYVAYADYGVMNRLYERVETLFADRFKSRYDELRADILSADNIIEVYERMTDVIKSYDGLLEEDYASTTGGGAYTAIPYKDENNIQQIRNFVAARLPYMDVRVAAIGWQPEGTENLLAGCTVVDDTFISYITGEPGNGGGKSSAVLNYIPVKVGAEYWLSTTNSDVLTANLRFYDAEKAYLAGTNINDVQPPVNFTVPEGCAYLRFYLHGLGTGLTIDEVSLLELATVESLDKARIANGTFVNSNTGGLTGNTPQCAAVIDYIAVEAGTTYILSTTNTALTQSNILFYDSDKIYAGAEVGILGATFPATFVVPTGCAYMRFHVLNSEHSTGAIPSVDELSLVRQ